MRFGSYLIDRRPLAVPAFRRLWLASAVTAVGGSFGVVVVPAQLFTLTGSSVAIGLSAAVSMVTLIVAALRCGTLADATDRRRLLLAGNAGLGLTYAGLFLQEFLWLDSVAVLLALVALQGASYGAVLTTTGAAVPRVVPADQLVAANSLGSLTRYTGAVVGPLLAGALIPVTGPAVLYLLDALALTVVLWAVRRLPAMPPARGTTTTRPRIGQGLRYLLSRRVLVAIIAVDLAAMVFALPFALYPELAERAYGGPPGGGGQLGLLFAAYPAGVLIAGLISGTFSRAGQHGALMAGAAGAWGCCVVLLGLAPGLPLALAALVAGGAVNVVLSTFRNAISQAHTDDQLRGRIQGLMTVVLVGGPQLANLLHGLGGAAIGARRAVCIGGALTIAAVVLVVRTVPELWWYDGTRPGGKAERRVGLDEAA